MEGWSRGNTNTHTHTSPFPDCVPLQRGLFSSKKDKLIEGYTISNGVDTHSKFKELLVESLH